MDQKIFEKKLEKMEQLQDHVNETVNQTLQKKGLIDNDVEVITRFNDDS